MRFQRRVKHDTCKQQKPPLQLPRRTRRILWRIFLITCFRAHPTGTQPDEAIWRTADRRPGCWPLVPKAFRANQWARYGRKGPTGTPTRVVRQAQRAEFRAVYEFVKAADLSGLRITQSGGRWLLQQNPHQIFNDPDWAIPLATERGYGDSRISPTSRRTDPATRFHRRSPCRSLLCGEFRLES